MELGHADIGHKVPKVELADTDLKLVDLAEVAMGRPTILAFFPGAFTGVCTKEMCAFRDAMGRFGSLNANVVGISVDGPFSNKEFKQKNNINFTLLSDLNKEAIKKFGIEFHDFAHVKGYLAAKRSVFIADSTGTIKFKWVTEDPTVEPDYAAIVTALGSIK